MSMVRLLSLSLALSSAVFSSSLATLPSPLLSSRLKSFSCTLLPWLGAQLPALPLAVLRALSVEP